MSVHNRQLSLEEIEKAIKYLPIKQQKDLILDLPTLLKISGEDLGYLRLSESSFSFWDNPEDKIYDNL